MKNLITILGACYLLITCSARELLPSKMHEFTVVDVYQNIDEYLQDKPSAQVYAKIDEDPDYLFIKDMYDIETKQRITNKQKTYFFGIKHGHKQFFCMINSERIDHRFFIPLEIEGYYSLALIPYGKKMLHRKASGGGVAFRLAMESVMNKKFIDKYGEEYLVMIIEPPVETRPYKKTKEHFGIYMDPSTSRKRYNESFNMNLKKKELTVEVWVDIVRELNKIYTP